MLVPRFVKIAPLGLLLIVIALVVAGLAFRFIADNANPPHAPLYDAQIKKELIVLGYTRRHRPILWCGAAG